MVADGNRADGGGRTTGIAGEAAAAAAMSQVSAEDAGSGVSENCGWIHRRSAQRRLRSHEADGRVAGADKGRGTAAKGVGAAASGRVGRMIRNRTWLRSIPFWIALRRYT